MECLNDFCIYQKDEKCMLDRISIDTLGMCDSCIKTNIDEQILEILKGGYWKNMMKNIKKGIAILLSLLCL